MVQLVKNAGRTFTIMVLLFSGCALCAIEAEASDQSLKLAQEAIAMLKAGKVGPAVAKLEEAVASDANDVHAAFFLGVAHNRLGNGQAALKTLELARQGGYSHPDLRFETGWANLSAQRYESALELLLPCEVTHPDEAKVPEFIGRCYFGLKNYLMAERYLKKALRKDKRLAGTVSLYLAKIDRICEPNTEAARQHVRAMLDAGSMLPLSQALLKPLVAGPAPERRKRPFVLSVSLGAGYNNNVLSLGHDSVLPQGISGRGSVFIESTASLSGSLPGSHADKIVSGGSHNAKIYGSDFEESNVLSLYAFLGYHRRLAERLSASVEVNDQLVFTGGSLVGSMVPYVGNDMFMNAISLRTSAVYRQNPSLTHEPVVTVSYSDYAKETEPEINRDGMTYKLGLVTYFKVPRMRLRTHAGVGYNVYAASGAAHQKSVMTVLGGVSYPLPGDVAATLSASISSENYDNPNSGLLPNTVYRSDTVMTIAFSAKRKIRVSRRFIKELQAYVRLEYTANGSNIKAYDYTSTGAGVGVTCPF